MLPCKLSNRFVNPIACSCSNCDWNCTAGVCCCPLLPPPPVGGLCCCWAAAAPCIICWNICCMLTPPDGGCCEPVPAPCCCEAAAPCIICWNICCIPGGIPPSGAAPPGCWAPGGTAPLHHHTITLTPPHTITPTHPNNPPAISGLVRIRVMSPLAICMYACIDSGLENICWAIPGLAWSWKNLKQSKFCWI